MPLTYQRTVANKNVVQLEQANQIKEMLTERKDTIPSSEVQEIVQRLALLEVIS